MRNTISATDYSMKIAAARLGVSVMAFGDMLGEFGAAGAALLSILVPISLIIARSGIKRQRKAMIYDLENSYFYNVLGTNNAPAQNGAAPINRDAGTQYFITSFEFVKYKYFTDEDAKEKRKELGLRDFRWWEYAIAAVPLCLVLFVLGWVAFSSAASALIPPSAGSPNVVSELPASERYGYRVLWVFGYIGAYLYAARSLLRSAENFDLTPMSFILSTVTIVLSTATAIIVMLCGTVIFNIGSAEAGVITATLIMAIFIAGFVPELGVRTIMRFARLSSYKRENYDVYKNVSSSPLEIIDGVDYQVAERLNRFNITSVQNLATANPVMLFVETPYGLFEVIDWVSQAQLCAVVGPVKFIELWKIGIRTVFDLERAVLDETDPSRGGMSHPYIRSIIAATIISQDVRSKAAVNGDIGAIDSALQSAVRFMIDDIHVHRLRQVALYIQEKLDEDAQWLPRSGSRSRLGIAHHVNGEIPHDPTGDQSNGSNQNGQTEPNSQPSSSNGIAL